MWIHVYTRTVSPLTILPVFLGNLINKKKVFGKADDRIIAYFHDGIVDAFVDAAREKYYYAREVTLIDHNAKFMETAEKEVKKTIHRLEVLTMKISKMDLSVFTNVALYDLLKQFHEIYADVLTFGLVNFYDRDLVQEVKTYCTHRWGDKQGLHFFSVLTANAIPTRYEEERADILRVAYLINVHHRAKASEKVVNALWQKYALLHVNYEGTPRSPKMFKRLIEQARKQQNLLQRIRIIDKNKRHLTNEQKKLERTLHIDTRFLRFMKAIRKNAELREYRKSRSVRAQFYKRNIIREIARRLHITAKEVNFLMPEEILKALRDGRVDRSQIKKRMEGSIYDLRAHGYEILVGQKARKLLHMVQVQRTYKEEKRVHGIGAFPGRVKGIVRVINHLKELQKFRKGEIFIGQATSPEFIPVFKKARAVITNEGGLTSHAAIVSREMQVPCIVGTGYATKVFTTGDKIEVDATKGIARKIIT